MYWMLATCDNIPMNKAELLDKAKVHINMALRFGRQSRFALVANEPERFPGEAMPLITHADILREQVVLPRADVMLDSI